MAFREKEKFLDASGGVVPPAGESAVTPAPILVGVITFSDTRTEQTDTSGDLAVLLLTEAGHRVTVRRIVREDVDLVRAALVDLIESDVAVIVTTGGTGISARDVAIDVLERLLERRLDGFGEAFRRLSWGQVGARSLLSRATAGTVSGKLVVALPGSEKAVRLGIEEVLLPILPHAAALLRGETAHPAAPAGASGPAKTLHEDAEKNPRKK